MVDVTTKRLVQTSWKKVIPDRDDNITFEAVGRLFFTKVFELAPEVRPMFPEESDKLAKHAARVIKTVDVAVYKLDELDDLVKVLKGLGKRHVGYGVVEAHYDVIGKSLLWTLEQGLGASFTAQVKAAWVAVWGVIAATMIEGAGYPKKEASIENAKKPFPHRVAVGCAAVAAVVFLVLRQ